MRSDPSHMIACMSAKPHRRIRDLCARPAERSGGARDRRRHRPGQGDRARAGALRRDGRDRRAPRGGAGGAVAEIGAAADWIAGDIREREEAERIVASVLERHGRLDVLVNNAGGQYFTPAEGIAAKGWRAVWRLNVDGMLNMAEAAFARALEPARERDDRQRDAVPPPRDAGHGALGRGARRGRGADARTGAQVGGGGRRRDGGGGGALRYGGAREVPGEPARGDGAHGARCSDSARCGSTPGSWRCSPRRWAGRSTGRRSRWTARATTGSARGRRRGWRTRRGRCRRRSAKGGGRLSSASL